LLITFKTRARYPNITMFGDVALQLLKLMGRRETVPSAIEPEDIPDALNRLRKGLAIQEQSDATSQPTDTTDDEEPSVSVGTRAGPLIELLEAAAEEGVSVMWEGH
jgi:hypothetical protein